MRYSANFLCLLLLFMAGAAHSSDLSSQAQASGPRVTNVSPQRIFKHKRVLAHDLCMKAYNILPQCADPGATCETAHSSAFLPGSPRRDIAEISGKSGFNQAGFDELCYSVCTHPEIIVDYPDFKSAACTD
jgi:hypothetical protein